MPSLTTRRRASSRSFRCRRSERPSRAPDDTFSVLDRHGVMTFPPFPTLAPRATFVASFQ